MILTKLRGDTPVLDSQYFPIVRILIRRLKHSGRLLWDMVLKAPEINSEKLHEPDELDLREWGEDIVFSEKSNIGAWIMVDSDSTVCPEEER